MKSIRYIHTKFLAKVAKFEGFRSRPYQDAGGTWTIGFGHTKGVSKNTPPISYNDALVLLANELENIRLSLFFIRFAAPLRCTTLATSLYVSIAA